MSHWIITHNPHPAPDDIPWNIYFSKKPGEKRQLPIIGDEILFYETESAARENDRAGEKALVRAAIVSGELTRSTSSHPKNIYEIACSNHQIAHTPVPYKRVAELLLLFINPKGLFRIDEASYQILCDQMHLVAE